MGSGVILVIGMASVTVAGGITEKILNSIGKIDAAQYMDIAVKSGLAITAITTFVKVIQSLKTLA
jgi:hypothetical protein